VTRIDELAHGFGDTSYDTELDISGTTNGFYLLTNTVIPPDAYYSYPSSLPNLQWYVKAVGTNGDLSPEIPVSNGYVDPIDPKDTWLVPPYFDGRAQLKENLIFLLRDPDENGQFQFFSYDTNGVETGFFSTPSTYAYAGYYDPTNSFGASANVLDAPRPFSDNYLCRNFVFTPQDMGDYGAISSGAYIVTDTEESRANVSRSRTMAIGAQGIESGETAQGIMSSTVDLNAQFGFNGSTTDEHSAQWTRPIQTSLLYYKQILIQIQPAP